MIIMDFNGTVGDDIRKIRELLGLRQEDLVEIFNKTEPITLQVQRPDVSKYECGLTMPPADKYKKFMSLLQ